MLQSTLSYLVNADWTLLILLRARLTYPPPHSHVRALPYAAFKLNFNCEPSPLEQTNFTGLRHEFIAEATQLSDHLESLLTDHSLPPTNLRDVPASVRVEAPIAFLHTRSKFASDGLNPPVASMGK